MTPSWYDLLDVDHDASTDEIRSAWKAGIADLDPTDRRFQLLNKAAGVLLDDDKKKKYDAELAADEPEADGVELEDEEPEDDEETADDHYTSVIREVGRRGTKAGKAEREKSEVRTLPAGPVVPVWLLAVLLLLTLAAAGGAYFLQRSTTSPDEIESNISAARTAAEEAVPRVLTYDYRYPERDHDRAMQVLTGEVADKYQQIWDEAILPNLTKVKGVATTQALGSGVVRASEDGDKVELVVVITTKTENKNVTTQVPPVPMTVEMVDDDGEWKIAKMDLWEPDSAGAAEPNESGKKPGKKQGKN